MRLQTLVLQNFRNHEDLSLTFPKEGALFEGPNGAGKTNILEGIHLLCTGRSQRGAARVDMIAYGQEAAFISGDFCFDDRINDDSISGDNTSGDSINGNSISDDCIRGDIISGDNINGNSINGGSINGNRISDDCIRVDVISSDNINNGTTVQNAALGFSRDKKTVMKINGENVASYSEWFGERPAVSFGADDLELVYGAPETRRKFLDMLVSQTDRAYLSALLAYRRATACRNALLGKTCDTAQFEVYEQAMAESAAKLVSARTEAVRELSILTSGYYAEISGGAETAGVEYAPKIKCDIIDAEEWRNTYLLTLAQRREKDAELQYSALGPHRDDLRFTLGGYAAKNHASQGQCRSFALSLKLASAQFIERKRGGGMVFLVDDAVSELDPERTSRVYPLLEGRGQVFIAAPRCQAALSGKVMRCVVNSGKVSIM